MVQLTRIYTKGGDKGRTSLGDGSRVSKDHPLIEVIGAIDETNAAIGVAIASLGAPEHTYYKEALIRVQHDLFDVGADLCIPSGPENHQPTQLRISLTQVTRLETELDDLNAQLAPLQSFVLPGGTLQSAQVHLARTIARRAERHLCKLAGLNPHLICYVNRLSDFLFVLARSLNRQGALDVLWVPGKNQ